MKIPFPCRFLFAWENRAPLLLRLFAGDFSIATMPLSPIVTVNGPPPSRDGFSCVVSSVEVGFREYACGGSADLGDPKVVSDHP